MRRRALCGRRGGRQQASGQHAGATPATRPTTGSGASDGRPRRATSAAHAGAPSPAMDHVASGQRAGTSSNGQVDFDQRARAVQQQRAGGRARRRRRRRTRSTAGTITSVYSGMAYRFTQRGDERDRAEAADQHRHQPDRDDRLHAAGSCAPTTAAHVPGRAEQDRGDRAERQPEPRRKRRERIEQTSDGEHADAEPVGDADPSAQHEARARRARS